MKILFIASTLVLPLLSSCDHIDKVGDKVSELKDLRSKSNQAAAATENTGPAVQDIAETDFQAFISQPGRLNIVDFHADWCGPCKKLGPVLSEVVESNSNVARLGKINVDQAQKLAQQQGVRGIPDVRFYIDGKQVDKFTGAAPKATIKQLVAKHSAGIDTSSDESKDEPTQATPAGSSENPTSESPEEKMKPMPKDWLPPGMSKG